MLPRKVDVELFVVVVDLVVLGAGEESLATKKNVEHCSQGEDVAGGFDVF
jgi:hypothetical protein